MSQELYRLHGLNIQSDLVLPTKRLAMGDPDLVVARGSGYPIAQDPPPGRIFAEASDDGNRFYTGVMGVSGPVVRFHGLCDFVFSADGTHAIWHSAPGVGEDIVSIMLSGTVLAAALMLRGHLVLHASAVRIGSAVLAFVGMSGMGKSTLAAMLCRERGVFVTDDVLRVDRGHCYAGAQDVRLKPGAVTIVHGLERESRTTADGRLSVHLPAATEDMLPLRTLVIPHIDREGRHVIAQRVPPRAAVLALSRFPRVIGWKDPDSSRRQFELVVELATGVEVWRCRVPWGPPFREKLADEILDAVGWRSD